MRKPIRLGKNGCHQAWGHKGAKLKDGDDKDQTNHGVVSLGCNRLQL